MAPIDIVINIVKRRLAEVEEERNELEGQENLNCMLFRHRLAGQKEAYESLIKELEGYKKLFS